MKSSPGEFVLKYFGTGDCNWMSRLRCFPYRGPVNDPYFVAKSYTKFAKQKRVNKTEQIFKDALIQAEQSFMSKIKMETTKNAKVRKWKLIERNKGKKI